MKPLYEPSPVAAAKVYAKLVGDHGHSGGWIHNRSGVPIVQGWSAYADRQLGLRVVVPKVVAGEIRFAINWGMGRPTGIPIICESPACPRVAGGLYGVNA